MDIIFKGRHTDVQERFRQFAMAKLARIEKLDQKAISVEVELDTERNPRQSGRKERIEPTITSRGPVIRAEAAADDRFAALDMAMAKLEGRLRRACDRRKSHGGHAAVRLIDLPEADEDRAAVLAEMAGQVPSSRTGVAARPVADETGARGAAGDAAHGSDDEAAVRIDMQGDGPLVVRQKFHAASPMTIDQALFEMELVGHDFFLFQDADGGMPSVVYRRRGYQYGVIRLVPGPAELAGQPAAPAAQAASQSNGQLRRAANLA